jgi:hypothetical protein
MRNNKMAIKINTRISISFLCLFFTMTTYAKELGDIRLGVMFDKHSLGLECTTNRIQDGAGFASCTKSGFDGDFRIYYSLEYGVYMIEQNIELNYRQDWANVRKSLISKFGVPKHEGYTSYNPVRLSKKITTLCWGACTKEPVNQDNVSGNRVSCIDTEDCTRAHYREGEFDRSLSIFLRDEGLKKKSEAQSLKMKREREKDSDQIRL